MIKVLIVGAGAQAKYVMDILSYYPEKEAVGIIDVEGDSEIQGREINGVKILGNFDSIIPDVDKGTKTVLAYSDNKRKEELVNKLETMGFEFETIIHPEAVISKSAKVGKGVIINANATIMPFARIGDHVVIHSNVVVEHDSILEDYVNLAPGVTLAGYVKVKKGTYVHTGASVIPNVTIGAHSIVGAGATVIEDVPDNVTVVGTPAKVVSKSKLE